MRNSKTRSLCRRTFFFLCLPLVFLIAFQPIAQAQVPIPEDLPIDPGVLKNASPAELMNLLKDYNQPGKNKQGKDIRQQNTIQKNTTEKDTLQPEYNKSSQASPDSVYGSSLFHNSQILQLTELSTPPPDYIIGVGDHIIVSLWGGADLEQDYLVGRDGAIFPEGLGKITVQGFTFANARSIIFQRFRKVIPSSTNISVTLGQPRSIVVQVSGNVEKPGPVVVSAFTNALNIVALAGGVTEYGNLRNILISRNGILIDSIDVYKYLSTGDFGKHLYLENNDFIIVPFYDKKVLASGQFKRPMYYQLKQGEGLAELLTYTGGITSSAYASGGIIIRNENEKQTIKTLDLHAAMQPRPGRQGSEPLYDGDVIVINPINQGISNKVIVKGEVAYPNVYEVKPGDRLFDIINRAGGITPNSLLDRAYVFKGSGDSTNVMSQRIDINLFDLNKNADSKNNIPIEPNDVIEIFNKNQFADRSSVSIDGEVRNPGTFQRYGGMTLKDLLYFAKGLKPSAQYGSIVVSSIVEIDSVNKRLVPVPVSERIYAVDENLSLDSVTEQVKLKPFDQVIVRKNPDFRLQQNIFVEGQVIYPGPYARLNEKETLSSFIKRSGGLKENSYAGGAVIYRMGENYSGGFNPSLFQKKYIADSTGRIIDSTIQSQFGTLSIDLDKALREPGSKYDMILQTGDVVYIPPVNPTVTVQGNVQSQLKMYFDQEHTRLLYYIDKAGGYGIRPWKKRIYITYADGKSRRTKSFAFIHFYPRVKTGSTIIVPQRPENKGFSSALTQGVVAAIPVALIYLLTQIK